MITVIAEGWLELLPALVAASRVVGIDARTIAVATVSAFSMRLDGVTSLTATVVFAFDVPTLSGWRRLADGGRPIDWSATRGLRLVAAQAVSHNASPVVMTSIAKAFRIGRF